MILRDSCLPFASLLFALSVPPRCVCLRCLMPSSLGLSVALPLLALPAPGDDELLECWWQPALLLVKCFLSAIGWRSRVLLTGMTGCYCGAAIVSVTAAASSYFFMKLGMQGAAAQAARCAFSASTLLHEASAATACKYVLCEF